MQDKLASRLIGQVVAVWPFHTAKTPASPWHLLMTPLALRYVTRRVALQCGDANTIFQVSYKRAAMDTLYEGNDVSGWGVHVATRNIVAGEMLTTLDHQLHGQRTGRVADAPAVSRLCEKPVGGTGDESSEAVLHVTLT